MKNITTNILGIIIISTSVYALIMLDLDLTSFFALCVLGGGLFYFENSTIKKYLEKGLNKFLDKWG